MTRSIELLLDEQTEAAVRADWDALAAAGLPSLAAHRSPTNRPHVTLAAGDGIVPVAPRGLPLEVSFAGLVSFAARPSGTGPRFVLARLVVLSAPLAAVHAAVHEGLAAVGTDAVAAAGPKPLEADAAAAAVPNSRPGAWTPHVTLARRMTAEQVGAAHALLGMQRPGRLVAARFWDSATASVSVL